MENVLVLPFFLFALMIFLSLAFDLICHVVVIAVAVVEWATKARRRKAMELPVTVSGSGAMPERTVTVQGESRRVIPIEGREVHTALPGQRGEPESVEGPDDEERMDRILQAALDSLGLQITFCGSFWTCFDVEEICLENPDDEEAIAKMVEYLRADGAEEDRWLGPFRKQFYWDASRRWAVTRANLIGHSDDRMWYDPEPDGPTLYIDVGVVEDAGVTWHGLWVHTFFWDRALEHGRLTVSIDGEPIELQMRSHAGCIDRSELYGRPVFEQKSIFNAPPGLLRKIARARTVRVRLDGQDEAIEKEFTRRNIACVRKFVRDNLVGEELRQDP
jgi:hypothetical protein